MCCHPGATVFGCHPAPSLPPLHSQGRRGQALCLEHVSCCQLSMACQLSPASAHVALGVPPLIVALPCLPTSSVQPCRKPLFMACSQEDTRIHGASLLKARWLQCLLERRTGLPVDPARFVRGCCPAHPIAPSSLQQVQGPYTVPHYDAKAEVRSLPSCTLAK